MVAPLTATLTGIGIILFNPSAWMAACPLLCMWVVSPGVAWWISLRIPSKVIKLKDPQRHFLRNMARRTWRYFETFVTADDNWLPPDNVHVNPTEIIASRTSPTNIGMALLADLAAYDFGYCSVGRVLSRTQSTFATLSKMERYRGHFFNWYNTKTLEPLLPRYVSTVDSGNLAGHLMVLGSGFQQMMDTQIVPARLFDGLLDTLCVQKQEATDIESKVGAMDRPIGNSSYRRIENRLPRRNRANRSHQSTFVNFLQ